MTVNKCSLYLWSVFCMRVIGRGAALRAAEVCCWTDGEQSRETQTELELLHVGNMCKPAADCQSRLYSHSTEQVHVISVTAWMYFWLFYGGYQMSLSCFKAVVFHLCTIAHIGDASLNQSDWLMTNILLLQYQP